MGFQSQSDTLLNLRHHPDASQSTTTFYAKITIELKKAYAGLLADGGFASVLGMLRVAYHPPANAADLLIAPTSPAQAKLHLGFIFLMRQVAWSFPAVLAYYEFTDPSTFGPGWFAMMEALSIFVPRIRRCLMRSNWYV